MTTDDENGVVKLTPAGRAIASKISSGLAVKAAMALAVSLGGLFWRAAVMEASHDANQRELREQMRTNFDSLKAGQSSVGEKLDIVAKEFDRRLTRIEAKQDSGK